MCTQCSLDFSLIASAKHSPHSLEHTKREVPALLRDLFCLDHSYYYYFFFCFLPVCLASCTGKGGGEGTHKNSTFKYIIIYIYGGRAMEVMEQQQKAVIWPENGHFWLLVVVVILNF